MDVELPPPVIAFFEELHRLSEAKHGEVAVYKFKVEGVRYTVRVLRTDPDHTVLT